MALVFAMVYMIVRINVYEHLDNDLEYEARKHEKEVMYVDNQVVFINKAEWEEREHREVQVNPVFIQLLDDTKSITDKSPNLKTDSLTLRTEIPAYEHHSASLQGKPIRQVYIPLEKDGNETGYLIAAIPLEDAQLVLSSLKRILLTSYPLILLFLFFSTRMLAGKSIEPVQTITSTADRITRKKLNERIPLPKSRDEIYTLTNSINDLLDRIEGAVIREKQFTSDASHELRTPLSVMKGTLEVLVRKPRTSEEYQVKISEMINEVDRMSVMVEQLLLLARFDNMTTSVKKHPVLLNEIVDESILHFRTEIENSNLSIRISDPDQVTVTSDPTLLQIAMDNLISNAVKYSETGEEISIVIGRKNDLPFICIRNSGNSIAMEDREHIFQPFFRGNITHQKKHRPGQGLGLSITKKVCDVLQIEIEPKFDSADAISFTLIFNESEN
ncbi:HAMP domain-containing protein [Fulvivirga sp. 1062]|uniref:histidine kinase n=2 Tax=Fulvivirga sedimenti TaxID=2879465 RepID=A0A9X1KYE2_9BACT|nr:HAMP domain-containing protein [Fulvivirga sedimenti]MCA6075872.1 HAMP domain-containing protein [Fulvivirga sedimenti]MCA6077000.1 HAMP domain-containing protein [Fulvivirga sedimenti]